MYLDSLSVNFNYRKMNLFLLLIPKKAFRHEILRVELVVKVYQAYYYYYYRNDYLL